ncbi:hypothetical protein BLNAU_14790 [Blattamonas nauphoetae]|uniref:Uncharacterized protein n=1 Tax=Blattamonas nauphoetae TaxID=2049346 RepID=A0ABQ9XG50_9EUKA|nr:hypothetical protein BLNAU_14790 [Blattamonas nauphoetae]
MPPKHKLGRKRVRNPPKLRTKQVQSSTSDIHLVNSTTQNSVQNDNESSVDTHSIPFTTDLLTITANDRHYVGVSKQILQYELKRKRINVEALMKQPHLEGDGISLPTSTTSDWRLVLQDSITTDDLRQGCISLFEQVNSGLIMTPNEVFHSSCFLEYAGIHMKYHEYPHKTLIGTVFPEEKHNPTKLTSALTKLVCHPSDKLRKVTISFLHVNFLKSPKQISPSIATTGLLPQLFESMKPHEMPINGITIDFHHHVTTIVDDFFDCSSGLFCFQPCITSYSTLHEIVASQPINPISQPFCNYLRHLIASPACPPDCPSGISLFSKMKIYARNINSFHSSSFHLDIEPIFYELRENMTEELASLLDLPTSRETLCQLLFGERKERDKLGWVETFERILVRLSEGRRLSDFGLEAVLCLMSNRPDGVKAMLQPDGSFSLKVDYKVKATLELPTSFISALIPTRPHYAAALFTHFIYFFSTINPASFVIFMKNGPFAKLLEAVNPSKLPFTNEFLPLHTQLVRMMQEYLDRLLLVVGWTGYDRLQGELIEIRLTFHNQTSDYIVHLALHPFALDRQGNDSPILGFFTHLSRDYSKLRASKPFRDEVRKTIDASALSLSSPPFILTSELVRDLAGEEIMNVVDRIVALLESDTPIDDDTILRICAFLTNKLKYVYLPELFQKAGRTTEQYFHTLNSLLSLPLDCFDLHPINSLLTTKPPTLQPTFDEWDDVDLATVGIVMPTIHENRISFSSASSQLIKLTVKALHHLSHCATRLSLSQLERLLTPSVEFLRKFFFRQNSTNKEEQQCEDEFIHLRRLCMHHVIAQALRRIGFFSRIVRGLLDDSLFDKSKYVIKLFISHARYSSDEETNRKTHRRISRHFLEEGWQDALDFVSVKKVVHGYFRRIEHVNRMMLFHGANV